MSLVEELVNRFERLSLSSSKTQKNISSDGGDWQLKRLQQGLYQRKRGKFYSKTAARKKRSSLRHLSFPEVCGGEKFGLEQGQGPPLEGGDEQQTQEKNTSVNDSSSSDYSIIGSEVERGVKPTIAKKRVRFSDFIQVYEIPSGGEETMARTGTEWRKNLTPEGWARAKRWQEEIGEVCTSTRSLRSKTPKV